MGIRVSGFRVEGLGLRDSFWGLFMVFRDAFLFDEGLLERVRAQGRTLVLSGMSAKPRWGFREFGEPLSRGP